MEKEKQNLNEFFQELQAFIKTPRKITLSNGKVIEIKPLSWKKELQILNLIGKAINETLALQQISHLENNNLILNNLNLFFSSILQVAPEILTEIVIIITDLDREYIENELILDDIIEIVSPFLGNILIRLKNNLEMKILPIFQKIITLK